MKPFLAFLLTVVTLTGTLSAQVRHRQYLAYEDLKLYHFGFYVGLHTQDLSIDPSGFVDEEGRRWYGSVPSFTPGFSVGVLGDLRLMDCLSLRLSPGIHFGSRFMDLTCDDPTVETKRVNVRSNYILLPIDIRYRGARTNNYRPYLLTGVSVGIDAGSRKREEILLETFNTYWEFGLGCDVYMPFFRLVPELKICIGLDDIFKHDRPDEGSEAYVHYTQAFDKMFSRLLVFSLQFE